MRRPFQTALSMAVAVATLASLGALSAATAEGCRSTPTVSAPSGSHWFYRIDRSNQRRCWFLRSSASGVGRSYALRHRQMNDSGATDGYGVILPHAETDKIPAATSSSSAQESAVDLDQKSSEQLTVTEPAARASEVLVPHKVTSIFLQSGACCRAEFASQNQ
jgi:hypothetical protein